MSMNSFQRSGILLAQRLQQDGIRSSAVLEVIAQTPRHIFVGEVLAHKAYENTALPIGHHQTISQPYIVAKMTELLLDSLASRGMQPNSVLEIGTGSGYQTAILAPLFNQVFSVERIRALQFQAKRRLQQIDLHNVSMKHGDGWKGWQTKGPFDAIVVTAAPSSLPEALLGQLKDGGVLVVPVGDESQVLRLIVREGDSYISQDVESVKFVPLVKGDLA